MTNPKYTIKFIKELVKLVVDNKLDNFKLDNIEISKSKHDLTPPAKLDKTNKQPLSKEYDDEEILFYSTSAPALTLEQIEELSVTNFKKHKD